MFPVPIVLPLPIALTPPSFSSPLVDLGQPSADREAPKTATALVNGGATLVLKLADDETIVQNGVRNFSSTATLSGRIADIVLL